MVFGIDVSDWQGTIDWAAVFGDTDPIISFVYSKATDGARFAADSFDRNHDIVRVRGHHFGAYHFFRFEDDPNEQAANFINTSLNRGRGGDLIPMVDVETGAANSDSLSTFLSVVQGAFKVPRILVYTDAGYWDGTSLGSGFSGHPLWAANFVHEGNEPSGAPYLPQTGGWTDWTVWQYDNQGVVPGIGNTDLDCCRDLSALLRPGVN